MITTTILWDISSRACATVGSLSRVYHAAAYPVTGSSKNA